MSRLRFRYLFGFFLSLLAGIGAACLVVWALPYSSAIERAVLSYLAAFLVVAFGLVTTVLLDGEGRPRD